MSAWPGLLVDHGAQRRRLDGGRTARIARDRPQDAEGKWQPPARQVGRYRAARAGARLQGPARLHDADLRCRGRRDRPDRGKGEAAGIGAGVKARYQTCRRARESGHPVRRALSINRNCRAILDHPPSQMMTPFLKIYRRYFGGAAAATPPVGTMTSPPVGTMASAVLVDFTGCGFVSVSTALLTNRSCIGLAVSSATGTTELPVCVCGSTSA